MRGILTNHLLYRISLFVCRGIALLTTVNGFAGCPNFGVMPPSFNAGTFPVAVAIGDFNGDGKKDLAVANIGSGDVSILLGNGDGSFASAVNYPVGSWRYNISPDPRSVVAGDFNGDGKSDLAIANSYSGNIWILLGNGDGTFARGVTIAGDQLGISPEPFLVVIGDFNGDGKSDLAVATTNGLSILLSKGDGTFAPAVNSRIPNVGSIAVGDFNGDGKSDLAVIQSNGTGQYKGVSILMSRGDGTFAPEVHYPTGTEPLSLAVGDFNDDGRPDLAVANYVSGDVSILLGNGNGTFAPASNFVAGGYAGLLAIGDFDGDGNVDLAVAASNGAWSDLSILYGNGRGSFTSPVHVGVGPSYLLAATDFNGDGKSDLVATFDGHSISILLGPFTPFLAPPSYSVGSFPISVATGDFNGDGKSDLAVANNGSNDVSILLGNGDGSFEPSVSYPVGASPYSVATGDFNGDGKSDLAVANFGDNTISILLGNHDGTLTPAHTLFVGIGPYSVAAGDFNGDGKSDLAVVNRESNDVSILLGNGDGTFAPAVNYAVGFLPTFVAIGDFNRDGKVDLAIANSGSNDMTILLGRGDGTFAPAHYFPTGSAPIAVVTGDFNGDGKIDLAVANFYSSDISILLGNGDGAFAPAVNYPSGPSPRSLALSDFYNLGRRDLVVTNADTSYIGVLAGNGDGTFGSPINLPAVASANALVIGDLNRDGITDLAVAGGSSGQLRVFLGGACISSLSPDSGPSTGDQTVTISGANLNGARSVTFGGTPATIVARTDTSITLVTPPHSAGAVDVVIISASGTATVSSYTYLLTRRHTAEMSPRPNLSGRVVVALSGVRELVEGPGLRFSVKSGKMFRINQFAERSSSLTIGAVRRAGAARLPW